MRYPLKRWMVGLDMTEMDEQLIMYTAFLSRYIQPEQIYFVHSPENLFVPEELKAQMQETEIPIDEHLKKEISKQVEKHFGTCPEGTKINIKVTEGSPLKSLLHWSKIKKVDLILVGKKAQLNGKGVLPKRMARKSACSIFFLPETFPRQLTKIMVGVDFSNNSKRALEQATALANKMEEAEILAHNIYDVPQGYHASGKSYEEFAQIMESHARRDYEQFMRQFDTKAVRVSPVFTLNKGGSAAKTLCQAARDQEADLILITSSGRTNFAALLLGSFAEEMVMENVAIPMLILKNKNKNMGVLDALLRI